MPARVTSVPRQIHQNEAGSPAVAARSFPVETTASLMTGAPTEHPLTSTGPYVRGLERTRLERPPGAAYRERKGRPSDGGVRPGGRRRRWRDVGSAAEES
ncbi:hypothetical protein GCM10009664_26310 [Kitasatospora gansuensis]